MELKPLADEKKITITYEEPKNDVNVMADATRFKEIIANLISNAVKYNKDGGWIKIYHEDGEQGFFITHIEDGGIGMSAEDQKRMFEKFFRAEDVKAMVGTGLGMFITKELVEKMGGRIWFRSEAGKGTRFSFTLPKAK